MIVKITKLKNKASKSKIISFHKILHLIQTNKMQTLIILPINKNIN